MEKQSPANVRRLSRDELYALVWEKPMVRLAAEFGVSDSGLAKMCRRLRVPYPPRGYWAKKEAGQALPVVALSTLPPGVPEMVEIYPTPPTPQPSPEVQATIATAMISASAITIPEALEGLHSKVEAWLGQHKREQADRERENKKRNRDVWGFARPLVADLTPRDVYRFRVTSAIFKAVEAAGGQVDSAFITGKTTFLVAGEKVECSIVEKMMQSFLASKDQTSKWTAYPEHHQSSLTSSGFLRVTITTYLPSGPKQWVETSKKKMADLLPEIVGKIIAAGPILAEQKREREERAQRYREQEQRRYEQQRLKQIDDQRWLRFRSIAADWQDHGKLLLLLDEMRKRSSTEPDAKIADRLISEWIEWAQQKTNALDPFQNGVGGLLGKVSAL